jgi:transcriptional regulator with XRE-family HTH domain
MPRPAGPPTVRLRRLAAELKTLRAEAQLTREQVQDQTGVNQGTLWRIEKGQAKPHTGTLETLFDLYGVDESRRPELIELARGGKQSWWVRQLKDVMSPSYTAYIGFESEAKVAHNYESLYVPGLLQTEEYARAALADGLPRDADKFELSVQTRMERQRVLSRTRDGRDPVDFWAVLDEAVLRRQIGGRAVMRAQLGRLLEMSERPNITLQVIPFDRGVHPGMLGAFVQLKFGTVAPDIVYVESVAGDIFLESEAEIERHSLVFDHLRATALSPRDTSAFIATLIAE